jgi:DNA topoisomerase 4 subunit A
MSKVIDKPLNATDYMDIAANNYASELNIFRAIPDIRDGLKPVQRDIVVGLNDLGYSHTKPHKKSTKSIGHVMGAYYSHGDASIYQAMVRLSQDWVNYLKLTDIHGNNGSIEGATAGAPRYTETRLSMYSSLLLESLNKNAVDFIPNFDNTTTKPRVLPARMPLAMINGASGIGWGIASDILPHNPLELIDGAIKLVKKPDATLEEMLEIIKGPDSPTGCEIIVDDKELAKEMTTGRAKYKMRSTINVKWSKTDPKLEITSLPYGQLFDSTLINKIADIADTMPGFGIKSFENDIDHNTFRIAIICKPGTTEEQLNQLKSYLYKKTKFETTYTVNNNLLDKGRPKSFGVIPYLKKFIQFRRETLRRVWQFDLDKANDRLEIINGLFKIEDILDKVVATAKESNSKEDFVSKLKAEFDLTERQANYIAGMQIYQLGNQNFVALKKEHGELTETASDISDKLTNIKREDKELIADLKDVRSKLKGLTRKSEIINANAVQEYVEIKAEDMIKPTPTMVIIKKDLQMFTIGRQAYNNQIDKYKDDDIVSAIPAMTTDYVVAITGEGKAVTRFVNDLQSLKLDGKAKRLNEEIKDLKANSEFVGGVVVPSDNPDTKRYFMLTAEGVVKYGKVKNLLPKVTNKGYVKRLSKGLKLKNDTDRIVFVGCDEAGFYESRGIAVTLKDDSKKSGKVTRKLELQKLSEFDDSAASSGRSKVNTKKGSLPFVSFEWFDVEDNETEND